MSEPTEPVTENRGGAPGWQAAMRLSRRVRALIVGGILFVVLFALVMTLHVPYVILSPGPTYNVLADDGNKNEIISILGTDTKKTTGNLNMTTVNVTTRPITAFDAIVGWLKGDQVVVPRASVYPPGQSQDEVDQQNTEDFKQSQNSAITAAACELGYPKGFGIITVAKDDPKTTDKNEGPSDGKLKPGDLFESVGGQSADTVDELTAALEKHPAGSTVPIVVKRSGADTTVDVTLGQPLKNSDGTQRKGGSLGVTLNSDPDACLFPFEVDLGLGDQIGGPSAGMMFALGILDKVGKDDLTDGRFIAGTGTIDADGKVGPIGGIQLKMLAARRAGATVFLAPEGNCTDVRGNVPSGLTVVKVDTLDHAVQYLDDLQNGTPVPGC